MWSNQRRRLGGINLSTTPNEVVRPKQRLSLHAHRFNRYLPFLAYLLAQSFIVAGLVTPRYPDSAGYLQLSFTGNDPRLWTVPLLYNIFRTNPLRVAAQVLLATSSWWFLSYAASRTVRDKRVRLGLRIVLLLLGLAEPISNWNSTILSDSAAVSLTAMLVGCWLCYLHRPTWKTALSTVVVTMLWSFTRNDLVLVGTVITAIAVIVIIVRKRTAVNLLLAVGLVAVSIYGLAIDGRNPYVDNANIADVIEQRVLANPEWTNWWIGHGMPYSNAIQATEGGTYGLALQAIPSFDAWLTADGTSVYAQFMATHPVYTLWYALPDFTGELTSLNWPNKTAYTVVQPNPTPSMLSPTANYGRNRNILPPPLSELLFEQGQTGDLVLLGGLALGLAYWARRRFGPDRRMWLPLFVALSAIPQGYLVWLLGGNAEVDRHAIIAAVSVRIGLWIALAYALDRIVEVRRLQRQEQAFTLT